ncbi:uncharacterized protein A4U43_C04F34830 [Asparagus officinalis]|uniref:Uncharacterized protein n=1 Tax=Asparagus officinalis TaxID=4686 RepID=A0A5P1F5T1_ASPOF|nr:uncharacterized protein A4U43_C04F34830 [Asparagus officinalis]
MEVGCFGHELLSQFRGLIPSSVDWLLWRLAAPAGLQDGSGDVEETQESSARCGHLKRVVRTVGNEGGAWSCPVRLPSATRATPSHGPSSSTMIPLLFSQLGLHMPSSVLWSAHLADVDQRWRYKAGSSYLLEGVRPGDGRGGCWIGG